MGASVEPGDPAAEHLDVQRTALKIGAIDVGYLKLTAGGGLEPLRNLRTARIVEVQSGHGVVGAGRRRLFLEPHGLAAGIELHDAIGLRVAHVVREYRGSRGARRGGVWSSCLGGRRCAVRIRTWARPFLGARALRDLRRHVGRRHGRRGVDVRCQSADPGVATGPLRLELDVRVERW